VEAVAPVGLQLVEQHPQQGLHARHGNVTLIQTEPVLELELG
jgi:hypothetical protein